MRSATPLLLSAMLLLPVASMSAHADGLPPATGLGQSWPNATDVSASPHYHVYVFERSGLRYVQVNDLNGVVRGAVLSAGNNVIGLPVGVDASRVATPSDPQPAPASTAGEVVYSDSTVTVLVAPQTDGTNALRATSGDCKDPIECSTRGP
ncbi:hypothetical protein FHW69_002719 [Luteibacter sp. Sphag1AF]|uniref:hypothetical protein n=1 Tax=Luteibacter sp. Sphag1AF TaxID=2587031 RepID=UPI0017EB41A4|nr:hypothetical protein [Luteibacter sp. Sphag1AF]MBB3228084.1 hypothetical protein [Luteibacter sp. Sphag1AF]